MNEKLCEGCGAPLTGMRRDAKFHGRDCKLRAEAHQEPLRRFFMALGRFRRRRPAVRDEQP